MGVSRQCNPKDGSAFLALGSDCQQLEERGGSIVSPLRFLVAGIVDRLYFLSKFEF